MTRIVLKSFTLNSSVLKELEFRAKKRGITVQELLRAVVIPFYLDLVDSPVPSKSKRFSERVKKGWETRRKNVEKEELRAKNEAADTGTGARPYEEYPKFPAGPTQ